MIVLLGFAGAMTYQAFRIARERDRADREAESAERVATFLTDMLGDVDPQRLGVALMADLQERVARAAVDRGASEREVEQAVEAFRERMRHVNGTDAALRLIDEEILDRAGTTIDGEMNDSPLIAARLRHTLAGTYASLGLPEQGKPHIASALETRQRELGPEHPDTLDSRLLYAGLHPVDRVREYEEVYAARQRVLGPEHPETIEAMATVANIYIAAGRYEESGQLYLEAIELARRVLGDEHLTTFGLEEGLGSLRLYEKRNDEAEQLYRSAYDGYRRLLGDDHRSTVEVLMRLTLAHLAQNRFSDAEALCRQVVESQERILGADHGNTLWSMGLLATSLYGQGRIEEADDLRSKTLEALDAQGWRAAIQMVLYNFASTAEDIGRRDDALDFFRDAVDAGLHPRNIDRSDFPDLLGDPEFEAIVAEAKRRADDDRRPRTD